MQNTLYLHVFALKNVLFIIFLARGRKFMIYGCFKERNMAAVPICYICNLSRAYLVTLTGEIRNGRQSNVEQRFLTHKIQQQKIYGIFGSFIVAQKETDAVKMSRKYLSQFQTV